MNCPSDGGRRADTSPSPSATPPLKGRRQEADGEPLGLWREVPGTRGLYQASRTGEVRRRRPGGEWRTMKVTYLRDARGAPIHRTAMVALCVDGKPRVRRLSSIVGETWWGPLPAEKVWGHANGSVMDYSAGNIVPMTYSELGRRGVGARGTRRSVEQIDRDGRVVALFPCAQAAAGAGHMSRTAVEQRCKGRVKHPYAATGYTYRYER